MIRRVTVVKAKSLSAVSQERPAPLVLGGGRKTSEAFSQLATRYTTTHAHEVHGGSSGPGKKYGKLWLNVIKIMFRK